jgi:hypothetical protein
MRADKPEFSNLTSGRRYHVGITGTGASAPTKRFGDGITVTRTAEGVLKFSFASHPGYFKGFRPGVLRADTPGDVKGHTITAGAYVPPAAGVAGYVELSLWDSTFAADDLDATEYLEGEFVFSESST